jgi:hypothetical protein
MPCVFSLAGMEAQRPTNIDDDAASLELPGQRTEIEARSMDFSGKPACIRFTRWQLPVPRDTPLHNGKPDRPAVMFH